MNEFKSIEEILDFAIKREEEEYEFYEQWKDKVRQDIRPLFEKLAEEEKGHKVKLLWVKSGKLKDFLEAGSQGILDLKMSDYLVDIEPKPNISYQDALILAIKREKMAFKLYEDLANKSSNKEIKDLFIALAQEEARHKLKLELLYDEYFYPTG
ncbi:MAG: ferritin family protein [candidate division WOR-3 bacterium]|uniref:Rubrerythrin n=1 Tax=candidate division WOR-3 bacterium TaxID=2052148 RepID=A0A7V3ZT10_UNCW3